MAGNALQKINARVKQLKRKHPNSAHAVLQKKASAQLRAEGVIGRVKHGRKKAAAKPARKVKVKIKPAKKSSSTITIGTTRLQQIKEINRLKAIRNKLLPGPSKRAIQQKIDKKDKAYNKKHGHTLGRSISGVHMDKVNQELRHRDALESSLNKHRQLLKNKGLTKNEKAAIRRDMTAYRDSISESKKYITALKRHIK